MVTEEEDQHGLKMMKFRRKLSAIWAKFRRNLGDISQSSQASEGTFCVFVVVGLLSVYLCFSFLFPKSYRLSYSV